uniref:Aminoacyl-transfer RNA synthetases class-II family profile domain-containing protein n=1 Tax=viral metagenome TaxID=1070528 RepID=A0A6C0CQJ4_9ZZZZ
MVYDLEILKERERAIWYLKNIFENELSRELNLIRVSAPLMLKHGTGVNDDLNGYEKKVSFVPLGIKNTILEIPNSLAKWKRMALKKYDVKPNEGLWTYMNAIRPDETLDDLHALYVDQYDWERVIETENRNIHFLVKIVKKIYRCIRIIEEKAERICGLKRTLPKKIFFFTSDYLQSKWPDLTPKAREHEICKRFKAVFISGIGSVLNDDKPHDTRAPDYDDWNLNGDLIVWHPVLERAIELSSMGIRVNKESLSHQLTVSNCIDRQNLDYHRLILNDELPLSIGGGIGQARLMMFILQRCHIGEVVCSYWDETDLFIR